MTQPFFEIYVKNVIAGGSTIYWGLKRGFSDTGIYSYQVQWAETLHGNWTDVDTGPLYDVFSATDLSKRMWAKELESYYRVILTTEEGVYTSFPQQASGTWSKREWLVARDICRKEWLRLEKQVGVQGYLLKRKIWGARCTACADWDNPRDPSNSSCTVCWGTGIVGGYWDAVDTFVDSDLIPRNKEYDDTAGMKEDLVTKGRFFGYPHIATYDIFVDGKTDRRWILRKIDNIAEMRGQPLVYSAEMRLAPFTDPVYLIPLHQPTHSSSSEAPYEEQPYWSSISSPSPLPVAETCMDCSSSSVSSSISSLSSSSLSSSSSVPVCPVAPGLAPGNWIWWDLCSQSWIIGSDDPFDPYYMSQQDIDKVFPMLATYSWDVIGQGVGPVPELTYATGGFDVTGAGTPGVDGQYRAAGTFNGTYAYQAEVSSSSSSSSYSSSSSSSSSSLTPAFDDVLSVTLDGVDEYLDHGDVLSEGGDNSFSLSVWFKSVAEVEQTLISRYQDTGTGYALGLSATGQVTFILAADTATHQAITPESMGGGFQDGRWHSVVVTYAGGSRTVTGVNIYVDGQPVRMSSGSGPFGFSGDTYAPMATFKHGAAGSAGLFFDGYLDESSFWGAELDEAEVLEIYNDGCPADLYQHSAMPHLVSWWGFGEDMAGTSVLDRASTNNGEIINTDASCIRTDTPCMLPFKLEVDTAIVLPTDASFELPLYGLGYSCVVDWGDGQSEYVSTDTAAGTNVQHTYDSPGVYVISVTGSFPRITFGYSDDSVKVTKILQWGGCAWTTMQVAFDGCVNITESPTDQPNFTKVTNFDYAFRDCESLVVLETGNWDMEVVTDIKYTWSGCRALIALDLANWNVRAVQLSDTFSRCTALTSLDLANWDVSASRYFSSMFYQCTNLISIGDTSDWDTSNAVGFNSMFCLCSALTEVGAANWDTGKATAYSAMFRACTNLREVDTSGWDTSSAVSFSSMFYGCSLLESVDVANWDTGKVTSMSGMFRECPALTELDVSSWGVSSVISFAYMFQGCQALTSLATDNWDVQAALSFPSMFSGCTALSTIGTSGWSIGSSTTSIAAMFSGCISLTELDTSNWTLGAASSMSNLFYRCESLRTLDVTGWDMSACAYTSGTFRKCTLLDTLDVSAWDTSSISNASSMFTDCAALNVDVSSWDISALTTAANLLSGTAFTDANYDKLLTNWASQPHNDGVSLSVGYAKYTALASRAVLISDGWGIIDGGPA